MDSIGQYLMDCFPLTRFRFRQKFKAFIEQYELRELHFMSVLRTKELEIQYHMARFEQQRKAQEVESSKSRQLTTQVSTFSQTETELRQQLNIYVEKFKQVCLHLRACVSNKKLQQVFDSIYKLDPQADPTQVEDTLNNSNDLFLTFRKEMEEMSKKTKRLEKENMTLTRRQETTTNKIYEMAEERTKLQKEIDTLRRKNDNLEKLCRGMQAQGRGQVNMNDLEIDEDGTESEYEYDDEDEEGSMEAEYDEDTEEEPLEQRRPFGPVPPPPPQAVSQQSVVNGTVNGTGPPSKQTNGRVDKPHLGTF